MAIRTTSATRVCTSLAAALLAGALLEGARLTGTGASAAWGQSTPTPTLVFESAGPCLSLAWQATGDSLFCGGLPNAPGTATLIGPTGLRSAVPATRPAAGSSAPVGPVVATGHDVVMQRWSPDRSALATLRFSLIGTETGPLRVSVRDANSGRETQLDTFALHGGGGLALEWSPDGRRLALSFHQNLHGQTLMVTDLRQRHPRFRTLARLADGQQIAWSPDGREVAASVSVRGQGQRTQLVAFAVDGSGRRALVFGDRPSCRALLPAWSARGLAFVHECGAPGLAGAVRVVRVRP